MYLLLLCICRNDYLLNNLSGSPDKFC